MTTTITITSGKGGVGKTNISVNLALQLARTRGRTCLFDADLGLANINILLKLMPDHTLDELILGKITLDELLVSVSDQLDIIPGSSGVEMMADLTPEQMRQLIQKLSGLDDYDYFIFDTSSGISRNVIAFCLASQQVLLIITPEPTSLTDAYALLKVLYLNNFEGQVQIIVNQAKSHGLARHTYEKFSEVAQAYLDADIPMLGSIQQDSKLTEAVRAQKALIALYPESRAAKGIIDIANKIAKQAAANPKNIDLHDFWVRYLKLLNSPLTLNNTKEDPREPHSPQLQDQPFVTTVVNKNDDALLKLTQKMSVKIDQISDEIAELRSEIKALKKMPVVSNEPLVPQTETVSIPPVTKRSVSQIPTTPRTFSPFLNKYDFDKTPMRSDQNTIDLYEVKRTGRADLICSYHNPDQEGINDDTSPHKIHQTTKA
ncbi:MAG: MinD/ParA family protein [Gammaproteobacteria bacterium]|nr:MinD/ParA family protein [Gammaproteobacteria bacterium]